VRWLCESDDVSATLRRESLRICRVGFMAGSGRLLQKSGDPTLFS
jgi:hypothetical protein